MKLIGLFVRFCIACVIVYTCNAAIVPIQSGYDGSAKDAVSSAGEYNTFTALQLSGWLFPTNQTGSTYWTVPEQVFVGGFTNAFLSANILSTNGVDVGSHSAGYYLRYMLYTNLPAAGSMSLGSPTNTFTPYYDSGNLICTVSFRNGTNITWLYASNSVSTNIFSKTNLAFGTLIVTRNGVSTVGSEWILGARITITR